ncbi:MAG: TlpA disulfide reductase family protein, partial [Saprospiraceae bacterium]
VSFLHCKESNYIDQYIVMIENPIKEIYGKDTVESWNTELLIGAKFPLFSLESSSGFKLNNDSLKGKNTFLVLWFTGCLPCVAEIPGLNRFYEDCKETNITIYGVTYNTKSEVMNAGLFDKIHYPVFYDYKNFIDSTLQWNFGGYPTIFFINEKQIIKKILRGGRIDSSASDSVYMQMKLCLK